MNIYFACSVTGGREFEPVYQAILRALVENQYIVPTAHLVESGVAEREAVIAPREVYARDVSWIRGCDILVAEVSVPSHGVGYEIGFALGLGKPVLALYQADQNVSKMISGNPDPNLAVHAYQTPKEAVLQVKNYLNHYKSSQKWP